MKLSSKILLSIFTYGFFTCIGISVSHSPDIYVMFLSLARSTLRIDSLSMSMIYSPNEEAVVIELNALLEISIRTGYLNRMRIRAAGPTYTTFSKVFPCSFT